MIVIASTGSRGEKRRGSKRYNKGNSCIQYTLMLGESDRVTIHHELIGWHSLAWYKKNLILQIRSYLTPSNMVVM